MARRALSSSANETVPLPEVDRLLMNGIRSIGYNDADATIMKDAMMWAQLRDNNQGIIKLTSGGLAKSGDAEPMVEFDSPTGARVNGNQAMSMVVLDRAVRLAIDKAQRANVGIVGTWNTSQSCGALGFYTEKICEAGLIGLVFATCARCAAPMIMLLRTPLVG
jgi:L-2-hydroxycarboxylate dehydrogenase (NAD+)